MFSQKKKDEYEEPTKSDSEEIDFSGIIVNALQMGFTRTEIEHMRIGEYVDMFGVYKIIHNMKVEGMRYKLPEKKVSMLDL